MLYDRVPPVCRPAVRQQPQQRAGHPWASGADSGQLGAVDPRVPHIRQKDKKHVQGAACLAGNSAPCSPQCSKLLMFSTQCIPLNIQGGHSNLCCNDPSPIAGLFRHSGSNSAILLVLSKWLFSPSLLPQTQRNALWFILSAFAALGADWIVGCLDL